MGGKQSAIDPKNSVNIIFNNKNQLFVAGNEVSGNISFQIDEDELVVDEIFLELVRKVGYSVEESEYVPPDQDPEGRDGYHAETTNYHNKSFTILCQCVYRSKCKQDRLTLHRGSYSHPFQFDLPKNLPPSIIYSSNSLLFVKYYIRIIINKPWFEPYRLTEYPLTIFPRVNVRHLYHKQEPCWFNNHNCKGVHISGHLLRHSILPGQPVSFQISLTNLNRSVIKSIEATLIQYQKIDQRCNGVIIFRAELPDFCNFKNLFLEQTFDLSIPRKNLIPTCTCNVDSLYEITIRYALQLNVHIRGIFLDFDVEVPIIVGTEST